MALVHLCAALHCAIEDRTSLGQTLLLHCYTHVQGTYGAAVVLIHLLCIRMSEEGYTGGYTGVVLARGRNRTVHSRMHRDRKQQRVRGSALPTELPSLDSVTAPQTHLLRLPHPRSVCPLCNLLASELAV